MSVLVDETVVERVVRKCTCAIPEECDKCLAEKGLTREGITAQVTTKIVQELSHEALRWHNITPAGMAHGFKWYVRSENFPDFTVCEGEVSVAVWEMHAVSLSQAMVMRQHAILGSKGLTYAEPAELCGFAPDYIQSYRSNMQIMSFLPCDNGRILYVRAGDQNGREVGVTSYSSIVGHFGILVKRA